jgi:hypothetical protein
MAHVFSRLAGEGWRCAKCGRGLEPVSLNIEYMGASFHVQLAGCPACGTALVDDELAGGRMLEVEKLLEDK